MCNYESAVKFLDAMRSKKNDAFVTCTYLNTPESVFAADIYCHRNCNSFTCQHSQKQTMVLLKLNQKFHGSFFSFISTEQRWLWVDSY